MHAYKNADAYTLLSKDRLLGCITTLQCGKTIKMLQAGIETRLILRQLDILAKSHRQSFSFSG